MRVSQTWKLTVWSAARTASPPWEKNDREAHAHLTCRRICFFTRFFFFFLRFCWNWTKRYLITPQMRVKRVSWIYTSGPSSITHFCRGIGSLCPMRGIGSRPHSKDSHFFNSARFWDTEFELSYLNKSVLQLRLAKTHPLFHVDTFWLRFKKLASTWKTASVCFRFSAQAASTYETITFSQVWLSGAAEVSSELSFRIEQSMSMT